ncbi:MAG TPA: hypothetical protein VF407_24935, partial [Polyangiaceae bacterium]
GRVIWQAHVSSWDGSFFGAASLVAASTAAVALADIVAESDPRVEIEKSRIVEEPWQVGGDQREQPTTLFSAKQIRQSIAAHATPRMDDPGSTAPKMLTPASAPKAATSRPALPLGGVDSSAALPAVPGKPARPERDRALTQSNLIVYALFGMLAIMLLALVGIILALASMKH